MSDGTRCEIVDAQTGETWTLYGPDDDLLLMHLYGEAGDWVAIPVTAQILQTLADRAQAGTPIADRRQRVIPFRRVA